MSQFFTHKNLSSAALGRGLMACLLGACLGLNGGAQAGPVTGNFDPKFGPDLSQLSYKGSFSFNVPDSLIDPGHVVPVAPILANASLTLYQTGNEFGNLMTANFVLSVSALNFNAGGHLVGFGTNSVVLTNFHSFLPAEGYDFEFGYVAGAAGAAGWPQLSCFGCYEGYDKDASIEGLTQLILHKDDHGHSLLGKNGQGQDLALRSNLVGDQFVFTEEAVPASAVPEPASLGLLLAAFGGLALSSRVGRRGR